MPQLEGTRSSTRSLLMLVVVALLVAVALEVLGVIDVVPGFGRVDLSAAGALPAWEA